MNRLVSENSLTHYGVLGMHWGRKRGRVSKSSSNSKAAAQPAAKPRRMSNKEITSRVKRLKLEKELAQLTAKPETKSNIEKLVKAAGTVAALTGSAKSIYENVNAISKMVNAGKAAS